MSKDQIKDSITIDAFLSKIRKNKYIKNGFRVWWNRNKTSSEEFMKTENKWIELIKQFEGGK